MQSFLNLDTFSLSFTFNQHRPADKEVCNWSPLHWAVTAEGKARLAVDFLRVANIRAVIAFINRHIYPGSFRMRLGEIKMTSSL